MALSTLCLYRHGSHPIVGLARGPHAQEVVVTVQGDGVLCYSADTQARLNGWPLGLLAALQFAAPAVFDSASQRFFAAVTTAGAQPLAASQLLSWPADMPAGPLERGAERTSLPRPVHSLHPVADAGTSTHLQPLQDNRLDPLLSSNRLVGTAALPTAPGSVTLAEPSSAERASSDALASTSGRGQRAAVFIVHSDGSVALDTTYTNGRVGALGGQGPPGRRVAAAAVGGGRLAVVCCDTDGGACVHFYAAQGADLRQWGPAALVPPAGGVAGSTVVAASLDVMTLALLWSDGCLQCLRMALGPAQQATLRQQVLRRLAGLALAGAQHTASKTPPRLRNGRNGLLRKRKGKDSLDGPPVGAATPAGPPAALLALGGGLFAAVAWAGLQETSQSPSLSPRLRVVVVEGAYGCARAVREVSAGALGGGALAPKAPPNGVRVAGGGAAPDSTAGVQAVVLGGGDGALALMANGAVLVAHVEAKPATLATLVGALSTAKVGSAQRVPARQAFADGDAPQPPAVSHARPAWAAPLAAAARDAAPAPADLAVPLEPRWNGGAEESDAAALAARRAAAAEAAIGGARLNAAEAAAAVDALLTSLADPAGSPSLACVAALALQCAEQGHWVALEALLVGAPLRSLAGAPNLAPLLAAGGRLVALVRLLASASDLPPADTRALVRMFLAHGGASAVAPREELHAAARAAAEALVAAAEAAAPGAERAAALAPAQAAAAALQDARGGELALHALVGMRHDVAALAAALQGLSVVEAAALAAYLHRCLLRHGDRTLGSIQRPPVGARALVTLPPLAHVVAWAAALLDAHFVGLAMQPTGRSALEGMRAAVAGQLAAAQGVAGLAGATEHVRCQAPLPDAAALSGASIAYSVELLDMRVRHQSQAGNKKPHGGRSRGRHAAQGH